MKEYIEREAAIKRFSFATFDCLGMEPTIRAADVVAALKSIPAADVVPVRHDESMALAMLAGARAIEQNSRKYFGTTFVHDPFGCSKEITYYEAAKKLRAAAEAALKGESVDV